MGEEVPPATSDVRPLRVLIADGSPVRLEHVAGTVKALGHVIVGEGIPPDAVGRAADAELADVALVIVGENSGDALESIRSIVNEASCPVIAILDVEDREFVDRAARLGIFAHIAHQAGIDELASSIDIALQRSAEYHALEGAFGRRAVTERAKGVLMERHDIDERQAFEMLRDHARRTNRKVVDIAEAVLASHALLPAGFPTTEEPGRTPSPPRT
jgi:AmiR/NasT family two-component response regulator